MRTSACWCNWNRMLAIVFATLALTAGGRAVEAAAIALLSEQYHVEGLASGTAQDWYLDEFGVEDSRTLSFSQSYNKTDSVPVSGLAHVFFQDDINEDSLLDATSEGFAGLFEISALSAAFGGDEPNNARCIARSDVTFRPLVTEIDVTIEAQRQGYFLAQGTLTLTDETSGATLLHTAFTEDEPFNPITTHSFTVNPAHTYRILVNGSNYSNNDEGSVSIRAAITPEPATLIALLGIAAPAMLLRRART